MESFDVGVRGSGVVAQCLALTLARQGLRVALATPRIREDDVRAYALNASSVDLLRGLKVWEALPEQARTPVYDMHIEGDRAGAVLEFSAWQQSVGELAWIVDAAALERELASAVRFAPHVTATDAEPAAPLLAHCEGRDSGAREALGIAFERHDYGQTAIAARLVAEAAHRNVARQWFRSPDVLALLPFDSPTAASSYALVWSLPTARAQDLLALDDAAFEAALNEAAGQPLKLASKRAAWPLMRAEASRWSGPGWVLLGDSAHVVHPLAGQGLNLGLADVAVLGRVIAARESWRPIGDEKLLRRYARERLLPTRAMGRLTEGLLTLFAEEAAPVRELRNRGLSLVNQLGPMKRWLASRALGA
jgi:2-polyprenyl-6-methoxyphenol hydroxylase-like FAD-dependent oxidoreductase